MVTMEDGAASIGSYKSARKAFSTDRQKPKNVRKISTESRSNDDRISLPKLSDRTKNPPLSP